jgi:tetratricopeptide (TPR) repeat protein
MKIKFSFIAAVILLAFVILSFPFRDFAADYYYRTVSGILDDEATEGLDVMPISEKAMPAYFAAIGALQKAAVIVPSRALYQSALSDIYSRLGKWSEIMLSFNAPIPDGAILPRVAADKALFHLLRAVALDPTYPDNHFALGRLYDNRGEPGLADSELKKAAAAFPVNAPLRYALAIHYLSSGRNEDALEAARSLAMIDDSYIIAESVQKADILERQPPSYISTLTSSYLYGAMEIAWRVSGDLNVAKRIAPDSPDAAPVVQWFINNRSWVMKDNRF